MNQPGRKWRQVKDPVFDGKSIVKSFADRIAFKLFGVIGVFGSIILTAKLFPDAPAYMFAVAAFVGVALATAAYDMLQRFTGGGKFFDWQLRAHRFIAIGFGVALVLSIILTINQSHNDKTAATNQEAAHKQQEAYHEKLRSPEVQRGTQALQQFQAMRERRAKAPTTAPSAP
jgi:hypothetical protein